MNRLPRFAAYLLLFLILILAVAVSVLILGRMDEVVEASGRIMPSRYVDLAPEVSGIIRAVEVQEGDEVRAGDTICFIKADDLEFETRRLEVALDEARARLDEAQEEYENLTQSESFETIAVLADLSAARKRMEFARDQYERVVALAEKDLASAEDLDRAKLDYELQESYYHVLQQRLAMLTSRYRRRLDERAIGVELAEQAYRLAQREQARSTITSPISGTVLTPDIDRLAGTMAIEGQPIVRIGDLSQLTFVVQVRESDLPRVQIGQKARIYAHAFPHRQYGFIDGQVSRLCSTPETSARGVAFPVEIELRQSWVEASDTRFDLKPGMSGTAKIIIEPSVRLIKLLLDGVGE